MEEIEIAAITASIPTTNVMNCSYFTPYFRDILRSNPGEISLAIALEQTRSWESAVEAITEKTPANTIPTHNPSTVSRCSSTQTHKDFPKRA
ncbi:hypothetical protein BJP36_41390 [Moorena producens JHB]|uniref:Uncharacterized protein n=1 Tax=Moorena producens (strain JHB) TaxID=1454205 RepID=A0A9Q9SSF4_MOOP1|nr:hypothetical protein [Moorena producens]WAN68819.1 hypothetical protein BJP36_41390 [Moorena producens JHB]